MTKVEVVARLRDRGYRELCAAVEALPDGDEMIHPVWGRINAEWVDKQFKEKDEYQEQISRGWAKQCTELRDENDHLKKELAAALEGKQASFDATYNRQRGEPIIDLRALDRALRDLSCEVVITWKGEGK